LTVQRKENTNCDDRPFQRPTIHGKRRRQKGTIDQTIKQRRSVAIVHIPVVTMAKVASDFEKIINTGAAEY
jgi:hypothetical protein